jgi:hypothetical protein
VSDVGACSGADSEIHLKQRKVAEYDSGVWNFTLCNGCRA